MPPSPSTPAATPSSTRAANSSVANPDLALWLYVGPGGIGRDFAPGFDFDNPDFWIPNFIRFNRLNVITEGLDSPITSEYTLSFGQRIGTRGFYKATWVDRDTDDIVENQIFIENGQTEVFSEESQPVLEGGFFGDNQIYGNSDVADRDYEAIQIQADYRLTDHWRLAGNYTYQIKNDGNFVGEATNQPVLTSSIDNYPEMFNGRNTSYGRLPSYQEHKVRAWSTYNFDFGRVGGLNLGPAAQLRLGHGVLARGGRLPADRAAGCAQPRLCRRSDRRQPHFLRRARLEPVRGRHHR